MKIKFYRKIKKMPGILFFFVGLFLRITRLTMRVKLVDPNDYLHDENMPCIVVIWHNRMLYFPTMFSRKHRRRTYTMVSPSRDGQLITDVVGQFGIRTVRGSTSKKSAAVLKEAEKVLKSGCNLFMTPDGPRGPKYKMSQGPIYLSSRTGCSIYPLSINASKYWQLKSWDNFQIAKPGAKIELTIGDRITIPPNVPGNEIEKWKQQVEDKLMQITKD